MNRPSERWNSPVRKPAFTVIVSRSSPTHGNGLPLNTIVCFPDNSHRQVPLQYLNPYRELQVIVPVVISEGSSVRVSSSSSGWYSNLIEFTFDSRCSFKLATFNVRALMRIGKHGCLTRTLETLVIDLCCIQSILIQDSSTVV